MKCCEKKYYFKINNNINASIYYNTYNDVIKLDNDIIPHILLPYLNNMNKLKKELFKINNIVLRKQIIMLAGKLKVAKSFIAKGQKGGNIRIPWKTNNIINDNNKLCFYDQVDLFNYLTSRNSKFSKILFIANNIEQLLRMQISNMSRLGLFCPDGLYCKNNYNIPKCNIHLINKFTIYPPNKSYLNYLHNIIKS
jgi:hypothetical protein